MLKKILLISAIALGLASTVSADMPWPDCWPCKSAQ